MSFGVHKHASGGDEGDQQHIVIRYVGRPVGVLLRPTISDDQVKAVKKGSGNVYSKVGTAHRTQRRETIRRPHGQA